MTDSDTLIPDVAPSARADSLLERYTRGASRPGDVAPVHEPDVPTIHDYGAFGWLRGVRDRAIMLEIRRKDGQIKAFGYAWLQQAEFDPAGIITLAFPGTRIRLHGRNLNHGSDARLFDGLLRHRVPYVQEADQAALLITPATAPLIERIEW